MAGSRRVDSDGEKIGDDRRDLPRRPERRARSGRRSTRACSGRSQLRPARRGAAPTAGSRASRTSKDQVKDAPNDRSGRRAQRRGGAALYAHYGRDYVETDGVDSKREPVGEDTSGPTTDDAMTRSEEELAVGTSDAGARPRAPAQVRRHRGGRADRPGPARGGSHRARADHRRQRRRRHSRPRDLRRGA